MSELSNRIRRFSRGEPIHPKGLWITTLVGGILVFTGLYTFQSLEASPLTLLIMVAAGLSMITTGGAEYLARYLPAQRRAIIVILRAVALLLVIAILLIFLVQLIH